MASTRKKVNVAERQNSMVQKALAKSEKPRILDLVGPVCDDSKSNIISWGFSLSVEH